MHVIPTHLNRGFEFATDVITILFIQWLRTIAGCRYKVTLVWSRHAKQTMKLKWTTTKWFPVCTPCQQRNVRLVTCRLHQLHFFPPFFYWKIVKSEILKTALCVTHSMSPFSPCPTGECVWSGRSSISDTIGPSLDSICPPPPRQLIQFEPLKVTWINVSWSPYDLMASVVGWWPQSCDTMMGNRSADGRYLHWRSGRKVRICMWNIPLGTS